MEEVPVEAPPADDPSVLEWESPAGRNFYIYFSELMQESGLAPRLRECFRLIVELRPIPSGRLALEIRFTRGSEGYAARLGGVLTDAFTLEESACFDEVLAELPDFQRSLGIPEDEADVIQFPLWFEVSP